MTDSYRSELPELLLRTERDALIPLLRARPDADFTLRTACPGWTVRHVLAHCGAALTRVIEKRFEEGVFTPKGNDRDIAERAAWSNTQVIDELERGMTEAGAVIARSGGRLDGVALGEWIHAGDVREAFGQPGAYAGEGVEHALGILAHFSRERAVVPLRADIEGRDDALVLGVVGGARPPARYIGDAPSLIRLCAGRPLVGTRYELVGAKECELNLFGW